MPHSRVDAVGALKHHLYTRAARYEQTTSSCMRRLPSSFHRDALNYLALMLSTCPSPQSQPLSFSSSATRSTRLRKRQRRQRTGEQTARTAIFPHQSTTDLYLGFRTVMLEKLSAGCLSRGARRLKAGSIAESQKRRHHRRRNATRLVYICFVTNRAW